MIYELFDGIADSLKTVRHFFRKFFCKKYCSVRGVGFCQRITNHRCKYYWCPMRQTERSE